MKTISLQLDKTALVRIAVALLFAVSFQGCKYYYKVQTVNKVTSYEVKKFDSLDKYIIIHQRDKAWHFSKPVISDSTLSGELSVLPEKRFKFLTTKPTGGNRYIRDKKPYESYVLEEVHLYVSDSVVPAKYDSGNIRIAFSAIKNAELYIKAKGQTTASWLIPGIGIPVACSGIFAIIIVTSVRNSFSNMGKILK